MSSAQFTIQKVSNHGTENPIVARLTVQTSELLQVTTLPTKKRQRVLELYAVTLLRRLLKAHDARNRLLSAFKEAVIKQRPANEIPFVIGLEDEVDTFLIEGKSIIRDSLGIFESCFEDVPTQWDERSGTYRAPRECGNGPPLS